MFFSESHVPIWLCTEATDMRKSFNGLAALAKNQLKERPVSGDYFVFINRRKTMMKILYFDRNGYAIWSKRLEQGTFQLPCADDMKIPLTYTQLKLILEGIDLTAIRQRLRYIHSQTA